MAVGARHIDVDDWSVGGGGDGSNRLGLGRGLRRLSLKMSLLNPIELFLELLVKLLLKLLVASAGFVLDTLPLVGADFLGLFGFAFCVLLGLCVLEGLLLLLELAPLLLDLRKLLLVLLLEYGCARALA